MQRRCCNCFGTYEAVGGMCPHCGYVDGEPGKQPYYLTPGTVLTTEQGKEYIIGEVVGAGGFGIIYKAWDTRLDCVVVIKEYFPVSMVTRSVGEKSIAVFSNKREAEYKRGLDNFWLEANIMSVFDNCENVCNTYDKFRANGTAYMVMEYLTGKTLKQYVKEKKNGLQESEILEIIKQVLFGLEEIHKRKAIHLDIAPDNILIMPNGKIKIIDFGAARTKEIQKDEDELVLKPGFAPPEQYRENGKLGPWTDIYAVGATLYWLLTNEVPLESTDREKEDNMQEPAMLTMVSPALNNVTMRAMAVRPELRYKNSKEFIDDLHKEKVRSMQEELKRRKRNRRSFLAAVGVILLAVALGAGYFGLVKNKIFEDQIILWVAVDGAEINGASEKQRYEGVVEQFRQLYPQIEVAVVVKDSKTIEDEFLNLEKSERPDIIENVNFYKATENMLSGTSDIWNRVEGNIISVLAATAETEVSIPTGFYVDVIYAQTGAELSQLSIEPFNKFLETKQGYSSSDSTQYYVVQSMAAGRYQLFEPEYKRSHLAEEFSIYKRSGNKLKAAEALLEYMLTDAAQDALHVQNQSSYMPISENAFLEYLQVYSEFEYLKNNLVEYIVE